MEEEDDDVASCYSTDIFELKDLSAIRESDELPVYETTFFFSLASSCEVRGQGEVC